MSATNKLSVELARLERDLLRYQTEMQKLAKRMSQVEQALLEVARAVDMERALSD